MQVVVAIIIILILWSLIEQKQLVTTKCVIQSAKLPKKLNNTSFIVLADLHNNSFGMNNERLLKRINDMSPEFIIVAGDMINKRASCYPSSAFTLLEQLAVKYKIYYAYGNHEQRMELIRKKLKEDNNPNQATNRKANVTALENVCSTWVEYLDRLNKLKVSFLDNESTTFQKNKEKLRITGISIGPKFFERNKVPQMEEGYLNSLIGDCPGTEYQILIAHNPVYFSDYAKWGADLTISGHLHGGMVRLPGVGGVISPQAKLFPKYHSGNFTENGQQMIVSRGLGSHSVMPRLFNVPEIIYVTMKSE